MISTLINETKQKLIIVSSQENTRTTIATAFVFVVYYKCKVLRKTVQHEVNKNTPLQSK